MSLDQDIVFERKITSDRNNYIIDNSDIQMNCGSFEKSILDDIKKNIKVDIKIYVGIYLLNNKQLKFGLNER